ncbi:chitooligosaccharidolytic beta-N-acetylglucosaminidase isoform X1 [Folsomia candida]|nr:chitooligosaccharidolytic beta-N-acetylglucosaminidase isoform X1 [Folsomia candida]
MVDANNSIKTSILGWMVLCSLVIGSHCLSDSDYPWTYRCIQDTKDGPACQREETESNSTEKVPFNICILTCGPYASLWPYPSGRVELGQTLTGFVLDRMVFSPASLPGESNETLFRMVGEAESIFNGHIRALLPENHVDPPIPVRNVVIQLNIELSDTKLTLNTDESYNFTIISALQQVSVTISGKTFFGVRHGLETLAQLIDFDSERQHLQIVNSVVIEDKPMFRYRGLLVDTGRNFIPVSDLKRLIDGMSYNKLNMFHWHITDSNSFPFDARRVPQMIKYGTYGSEKIYTPEAISEFLVYSNQRGVKVIPEFDMPSHAGNGWQWGEKEGLGELSLCVNAEPYQDYCIQPPCGQLNPLNNNMYNILGELFRDFLDVFDKDVFHMGGDEISFKCWLKYPHIIEWMETNNKTIMDLWGLFQENALTKLKEANDGRPIDAIVWTSEMTSHAREFLSPDDYIIQIWSKATDDLSTGIYQDGYRVIFSNNDTVYLDHGYGPWRGNYVNPAVLIKTWQVIYANDILGQVENLVGREKMMELYESGKLLGGVATLWSEKGDKYNMDMKMWPRGAAYAERLWSNPPSRLNVTQLAYPRLIHQRERLVQRGIHADTLLPEACRYIWGFCDNNYS